MVEESMKDFEQEINESFKTAKKAEDEDSGKREYLQNLIESKEQFDVKIIEAVKGGCIAYLEDTHTFIPTSQFSPSYVERLEDYANKYITVIVIMADSEKKCLVLSHHAIEQEEKEKEKAARLAEFKTGDVLDGKVESLRSYSAFIDLGGATGFLYIPQILRKRVKISAGVSKEGQEIKIKIIETGNGKTSLPMRALEKLDNHSSGRSNTLEETGGFKYEEGTRATTSLGDLLKNIGL